MNCPFCNYFEYAIKTNTMNFFYCKKEDCNKASCIICKKEVPKKLHLTSSQITDLESHFQCMEHKQLKEKFDECIYEGSKMRCPYCGKDGRKDDACTHMQCVGC